MKSCEAVAGTDLFLSVITNREIDSVGIRLYRGDDSRAFDQKIMFPIFSGVDYSGCHGLLLFGDDTRQIRVGNGNTFSLDISAEESRSLEVGTFYARLKVFDSSRRGHTLSQQWKVEILDEVCRGELVIAGETSRLSEAICGVAILGKE